MREGMWPGTGMCYMRTGLTREEVLGAQGGIMGGRILGNALQDNVGWGRSAQIGAGLLLKGLTARGLSLQAPVQHHGTT